MPLQAISSRCYDVFTIPVVPLLFRCAGGGIIRYDTILYCVFNAEVDMGRVHPSVRLSHKILHLGWVGSGRVHFQNRLTNIQFTQRKPIIRPL